MRYGIKYNEALSLPQRDEPQKHYTKGKDRSLKAIALLHLYALSGPYEGTLGSISQDRAYFGG